MTIGVSELEVDLSRNKIVLVSLGKKKARVQFNSVYNVNGIKLLFFTTIYTSLQNPLWLFTEDYLTKNPYTCTKCFSITVLFGITAATEVSVLQCSLLMQACMCVVYFRNKGRIGGVDDRHQENCK